MAGNMNTAYDFSKFESPEAPNTAQKPKPKMVALPSKKRKPRVGFLPKLCLVALMISMIVYVIYNQVIVSELSDQVSEANASLTTLESENTRLAAELAANSSYRALEEYATYQLGLSKLESSQIIYIDMEQSDRIEITENGKDQTGAEKIFAAADGVMEYLSLE